MTVPRRSLFLSVLRPFCLKNILITPINGRAKVDQKQWTSRKLRARMLLRFGTNRGKRSRYSRFENERTTVMFIINI